MEHLCTGLVSVLLIAGNMIGATVIVTRKTDAIVNSITAAGFLYAAFNSPLWQIVKAWKSHRKGGFSTFWWTTGVNSRTHYFSGLRADF